MFDIYPVGVWKIKADPDVVHTIVAKGYTEKDCSLSLSPSAHPVYCCSSSQLQVNVNCCNIESFLASSQSTSFPEYK